LVLYGANCAPTGETCTLNGERAPLVDFVAAAHLTGSFQLFDRLQVGVVLPLAVMNSGGFRDGATETVLAPQTSFALADPRLSLRGRILSEAGFSLALSAFVTAPVAQAIAANAYLGDGLPSFGGNAIVEYTGSGALDGMRVAANLGATWRQEVSFFSSSIGPQLTYAVAGTYAITPLIGVYGELVGASGFTAQLDEHSLEWRAGGRLRVEDFDVHAAIGTGLITGVGTPLVRVVAGGAWAPMRGDEDGDGVDDRNDSCPTEREDRDDFRDEDGCPEADNDEDGLLDGDDQCPSDAEDLDEFEDANGCPDPDNDADGVPDGYDSCASLPEDRDGDRDEDGCPDEDRDHDAIPDASDRCVDAAEDFDGFGDEDGCPEEDFDEDALPDEGDQCPDQPEDTDGQEDEDGCPE
jgi:hypothetical protein